MKRALVILRAGEDGGFPDWFYQPFPVSNAPSGETTHFASLLVGSVPLHYGQTLTIQPTDTLKSVLSRAGFSRAGKTTPAQLIARRGPGGPPPPTEAKTVPPPEPPGLFSRVKKWFSRK